MDMTLTQAAFWTKRAFIGFVILVFLGVIIKVGYDIWYAHYLANLPKVEEKPDLKFGALPQIQFPPTSVSTSNFSYSIDTENGNLPQMPKIMKVYFIPQATITLLSPDKANRLAQSLGFFNGPQVISQIEYHYSDNNSGLLSVNLPTGNFHFQRSASVSASPTPSPTPSSDKLVNDFKSYLAAKNLLPPNLTAGRSNVIFGQKFEVSLWPSDFESLPIVTASAKRSLIRGILTDSASEPDKFLQVDYTYWPADATTFATYPVKSAEAALSDLKAGLGFVSLEPQKPQVSISKVYPAYFESENYTPYLEPVYVFEGEGFQALVPAILSK